MSNAPSKQISKQAEGYLRHLKTQAERRVVEAHRRLESANAELHAAEVEHRRANEALDSFSIHPELIHETGLKPTRCTHPPDVRGLVGECLICGTRDVAETGLKP